MDAAHTEGLSGPLSLPFRLTRFLRPRTTAPRPIDHDPYTQPPHRGHRIKVAQERLTTELTRRPPTASRQTRTSCEAVFA